MNIGVVIPTYNRRDNLLMAISALAQQTYQDFYLVIADDGSTDGTEEAIAALMQTPTWHGRLIWAGFVPERDIHPSRARNRNKGVAHLPAECSLICFLDSDVLLNREALAHYAQAHAAQPDALILGVVDWLPPLPLDEAKQLVDAGQIDQLRTKVPADTAESVQGTYVGRDLRVTIYPGLYTDTFYPAQKAIVKNFLTTNLGCPTSAWRKLGGFDEGIIGYGAEDIEFGCQVANLALPCLYNTSVWALHVWHPKTNPADVQLHTHQNLGRVIQKHGLETFVPSFAATRNSTTAKLSAHQPDRPLSDGEKMLLALRLRQKRQQYPESK